MTQVILVTKHSSLEFFHDQGTRWSKAATELKDILRQAQDEHYRSLEHVEQTLEDLDIPYRKIVRGEKPRIRKKDLIVTVGGDGTLLEAARWAGDCPIFGVNSDIRSSVAHFSCAEIKGFRQKLSQYLDHKLKVLSIPRMQTLVNEKAIGAPVLNDVLYAHQNPAATTRYKVTHGSKAEVQRSSGIWISTAAGSSAAMRAAGGQVHPITSRVIQFRVREVFKPDNQKEPRIVGGKISPTKMFSIDNNSPQAALWLDGSHHRFECAVGDRICFEPSAQDLRLVDPGSWSM